ncbi:MAG: FkbM family methyltransferase [Bacteroidetes bacterium]|nr:FkbM family methyltransferase [Bacteroidota bacterium]
MSFQKRIREKLIKLTGYWIYKQKHIPIGCDLYYDLKYRIGLPMNIVFDIGANEGQTALPLHNYFSFSDIYCIEPVMDTYNILTRNTSHIKKIKRFQIAFGENNENKSILLFDNTESCMNSLNEVSMNNYEGAKNEIITIVKGDDFCLRNNIKKIDLLKIDTEGYEIQVINGFSEMIKNNQISAVYCEAGFNPQNVRNTYIEKIHSLMYKNNFSLYGVYEISNWQIKTGNNYGNFLYLNNEFIKNSLLYSGFAS